MLLARKINDGKCFWRAQRSVRESGCSSHQHLVALEEEGDAVAVGGERLIAIEAVDGVVERLVGAREERRHHDCHERARTGGVRCPATQTGGSGTMKRE